MAGRGHRRSDSARAGATRKPGAPSRREGMAAAIAAAAGRSGIPFDSEMLSISIGPYQLLKCGEPLQFDREKISQYINSKKNNSSQLKEKNISIRVLVGEGNGSGLAWGCDFSEEYIHINADYTT